MTTETISPKIFGKIPIFTGMTPDECRQLADLATVLEFEPGEVIVRQGKASQRMFVILEGVCEVVRHLDGDKKRGEPTVLAELGAYGNFGEMSFFHKAPHSATVRAKTTVKLLRIDRSRFNSLVDEEGGAAFKLALNTVDSLAERVRQMSDWVVELTKKKPEKIHTPEWSQLRDKLFDGWKL